MHRSRQFVLVVTLRCMSTMAGQANSGEEVEDVDQGLPGHHGTLVSESRVCLCGFTRKSFFQHFDLSGDVWVKLAQHTQVIKRADRCTNWNQTSIFVRGRASFRECSLQSSCGTMAYYQSGLASAAPNLEGRQAEGPRVAEPEEAPFAQIRPPNK